MIQKYFDHIDQLYVAVVKLVPKTYNNQIQYSVDQAVAYTDYAEFQDFIRSRQLTSFCLMYTQDCVDLVAKDIATVLVQHTQTTDYSQIVELIHRYPHIVILSNNKSASYKLFQFLIQSGVTDTVKCLVENVTG